MTTETRTTFLARFDSAQEAACFETQLLSIGSEFLPPEAIAARDGRQIAEDSPYWQWAAEQHDMMAQDAADA